MDFIKNSVTRHETMSDNYGKTKQPQNCASYFPVISRKKSRKKKKKVAQKYSGAVNTETGRAISQNDVFMLTGRASLCGFSQSSQRRSSCASTTSSSLYNSYCLPKAATQHTSLPSVCEGIQKQGICASTLETLRCRGDLSDIPSSAQPLQLNKEPKKQTPLLTAIKPENEKTEKDRFFQAKYIYNPVFIYRSPASAEALQRFSTPGDRYLNQAVLILEKAIETHGCYENFEVETGGKVVSRPEIVSIVKRYLKQENLEDEIRLNLSEDLLSRASMTKGKGKATLNVRIVNLREYWVEGLLRHEIGTHYLRSCNNRNQVWSSWKTRKELGLRNFNPTEEGLASLHSVVLRNNPSLFRSALLYYTAYQAAHLPFKELFKDLGQFVKDPHVRWDYCMRAKRGQADTSLKGCFCKDQVYLVGALELLKHRHTIDFQLLLSLGKIAYQDIEKLEEQADLTNTRIPSFMKDYEHYKKCLDRVAACNGLTDDILASL